MGTKLGVMDGPTLGSKEGLIVVGDGCRGVIGLIRCRFLETSSSALITTVAEGSAEKQEDHCRKHDRHADYESGSENNDAAVSLPFIIIITGATVGVVVVHQSSGDSHGG